VGYSFFAEYGISSKDIIIFAILSALGFAFIENIVYTFRAGSLSVALSRNLTTVVMHTLFTGMIAYLISCTSKKNRLRYAGAFIIGMCMHRAYDGLLGLDNGRITAAIILIGYFGVSFLLYKSDRLYLPK